MPLNLPSYPVEMRVRADGVEELYDSLRRRWVVITPEEWVRQHFVNFLVNHRGFPSALIANEVGLKLNATSRRCDTVVFDRRLRPLVIVEYKAPTVAITQKVFDQIARYNIVMEAPYLIVSNGLRHYCCRYDRNAGTYVFLPDIPMFADLAI